MGKQSQAFLDGEGEAYAERNKLNISPFHDPVIEAIAELGLKPTRILEIGCGDGQRLSYLMTQYKLNACCGIDPAAPEFGLIYRGTADDLSMFEIDRFDLVIYGFCLYLCDPEDYFRIAMEGDRVLQDGGYMIIHDFYTTRNHKTPYKHKDGIFSYHTNFATLWAWHPAYFVEHVNLASNDGTVRIFVLQKDTKRQFPVRNK